MQKSRPAEFIALVAFLTALVAMSIDTMLPAVGQMSIELGATHPNDRQLIIIGFFAGQMLGIPIFGPWSDSIGRKPAIFIGLVIYVAGALLCMFSSSFYALIAGRVIQGIGASAPRIVSMAMVRDGAKGAAMARIMSFVMSVFMLVPILAPSIGQLVLYVATWRYIFGGLMVAAIIGGIWLSVRQGETLPVERRLPFSAAKLWSSAIEVVSNPVALGYTLATGFVFGVFVAYLGVCQQIFAEQYHQGDKFALWFGGFAIFIALAMITNGNLVSKLGMRKLSKWATIVYAAVWIAILLACLMTAGNPPLLILAPLFAIWFFSAGFTFGNFNAMSMEPMGHIAGMAAAVSGFISQAMAIALGGFAGRYYDGTLTPLAVFFAIYSIGALACTEWAESRRKLVIKSGL
jgi:DHA1 family bicyclomycin/chloramphenicol resistance-like MFS transporter